MFASIDCNFSLILIALIQFAALQQHQNCQGTEAEAVTTSNQSHQSFQLKVHYYSTRPFVWCTDGICCRLTQWHIRDRSQNYLGVLFNVCLHFNSYLAQLAKSKHLSTR